MRIDAPRLDWSRRGGTTGRDKFRRGLSELELGGDGPLMNLLRDPGQGVSGMAATATIDALCDALGGCPARITQGPLAPASHPN